MNEIVNAALFTRIAFRGRYSEERRFLSRILATRPLSNEVDHDCVGRSSMSILHSNKPLECNRMHLFLMTG